jgi:membrane protease YdiL (CAAX protease family)
MNRRLGIFVGTSFGVSWAAWGSLVPLARARTVTHGQPPFMFLYMLGGLGPTIAAYTAVLATSAQGSVAEFHGRLLRWRLTGWWYLAALGIPVALAMGPISLEAQLDQGLRGMLSVQPWYRFLPLFALMIAGGGLEELGWRGIAQPELERGIGRARAALLIGLVWIVWHVPLFFIPGVSQSRMCFPVFAVNIIGAAQILAWLYSRTSSILLCIFFHAASNAIVALGFALPRTATGLALVNASVTVGLGSLLLLSGLPRSRKARGKRSVHGAE